MDDSFLLGSGSSLGPAGGLWTEINWNRALNLENAARCTSGVAEENEAKLSEMAGTVTAQCASPLRATSVLKSDSNWNRALNMETAFKPRRGELGENNSSMTNCLKGAGWSSYHPQESGEEDLSYIWKKPLTNHIPTTPLGGQDSSRNVLQQKLSGISDNKLGRAMRENNSSLGNCFKEAGWASHRYPGEESGEEDLSYIWKKPLTSPSLFHTPTTPLGGQDSSRNVLQQKLAGISDNKLGRVMQKKSSLYAKAKENPSLCQFCKKNGESKEYYTTHSVKVDGKVTCPILWRYICPKCGATGESAHTLHYCPLNTGWRKPTRALHNAGGRIVYVPPRQ